MKRLLSGLCLAAAATAPCAADFAQVQSVLAKNGCQGCHALDAQVTGPSYHDIANRYVRKPNARSYLEGKIRDGSANTWGAAAMPPNPQVSNLDMTFIVDWLATGAIVPAGASAPGF
jgi:cytochrome c